MEDEKQSENYGSSYEEFMAQGKLGRHETFTPRYGWLKKGYDAASREPDIFRAADAIEQLGVGKNMVRSIKFWCQAFKVLQSNDSVAWCRQN